MDTGCGRPPGYPASLFRRRVATGSGHRVRVWRRSEPASVRQRRQDLKVNFMNDAQVSIKELTHRIRNPRRIASHSLRVLGESSAPMIPSEFNRLFVKVRPLTMVSYSRLRGLQRAVKHIVKHNIAG